MSKNNVDNQSDYLKAIYAVKNYLNAHMVYRLSDGARYAVKVKEFASSNVISVIDKCQKRWIVRVDLEHAKFPHKHININPKYAGIKKDPHLIISDTVLNGAYGSTKVVKYANKINEFLGPAIIIFDGARLSHAAYKDYQEGSDVNLKAVASQIASSWIGSYLGVKIGSTIGTLLLPGIGTITLAYAGAIYGCYYGVNKFAPIFVHEDATESSTPY